MGTSISQAWPSGQGEHASTAARQRGVCCLWRGVTTAATASSLDFSTSQAIPQNLHMANSHKTRATNLSELRGMSIRSGSAKRRQWLPSVAHHPPAGRAEVGAEPQGNPTAGLTAPPDSPPTAGNSPHFPCNRLLGAGSTMAINKFGQRSAAFRLATQMGGGKKKLGILRRSTNHVQHKELRN